MQNGTTDILISCEEPTPVRVEDNIEFDGQFGMVRLVDGEVKYMRMTHARLLKLQQLELTCEIPAYRGRVTRVDASDPMNNRVFLDPPLPSDAALVERTVHFQSDVPWDTSYDIESIGDGWISTGDHNTRQNLI